jgi:hypothetical protein
MERRARVHNVCFIRTTSVCIKHRHLLDSTYAANHFTYTQLSGHETKAQQLALPHHAYMKQQQYPGRQQQRLRGSGLDQPRGCS